MITISVQWLYALIAFLFLAFWLILWVFNTDKSLRRKQLMVSAAMAVGGPVSELLYFQDYWHPMSVASVTVFGLPLFLESVVFGFAFAGIASALFSVLTRAHVVSYHMRALLALASVIPVATLVFLLFRGGPNSILTTSLFALAGATIIVFLRRDLLVNALGSGIATMIATFFLYQVFLLLVVNTPALINEVWLLEGTPLDIRIADIPLTELCWAFSWGAFLSPLYDVVHAWKRSYLGNQPA